MKRHIRYLAPTGLLTLALFLSLCVFSGTTFALPTAPLVSGHQGDFNLEYGHNHPGPQLSNGSSAWEDYDREHVNEDWDDSNGGGHDDGEDDGNTSPVPEPATALLMSLGLAGAAYLKRRRR